MLHDLILNTALLVVLSAFYEILARYKPSFPHITTILMGFFFGAVAITSMLIPFLYSAGILIDGRSIVLVLGGLFGGPLVAVVSAVMAAFFRIFIGGEGTLAGILIILLSASLGVWIRHYLMDTSSVPTIKHLFFTAIGAHFLMLLSMLLLPWPGAFDVMINTGPIVMTLFPAITMLIGFLMISAEKRLQAEKELRENEALYRTTLYSIGDAVILTDRKGRVKKMNDMAAKLTGWTEEEAQNKPVEKVFDIINEYSRQKVESPVSKVMSEGSVVELANHTMLRTKKGKEIPIADSGAPVIDDRGQINGVVMVFQDQTRERQQQNELKKSHEKYRNLIETTSAITWEYDIHKDRWTYVSPQVTKILQWNPDEWTDLAFWKAHIHPADRDFAVDYCLSSTQKQMNHTLEYRFKKKGGDYVWLRDVVTVESENGQVRFKVADTGMGIPKDKHGVIFDRFSQANEEISSRYGGTGLGLAIVQKLTEMMGSGIFLDSEPGKGSTFWFEVPGNVVSN